MTPPGGSGAGSSALSAGSQHLMVLEHWGEDGSARICNCTLLYAAVFESDKVNR
jgi:hypothetical protein